MHRLLIPMLACFFLSTPALLRAQVPHEIQYLPFDPPKVNVVSQIPEMPCGDAGTFTFGQFIGSSNDLAPSPIFLCFGDSLLVQHNGDADLSGDPDPATQPGIAYGFYTCPPTIMGPTLQDIIGAGLPPTNPDPCLLPGSANGMYITQPVANGGGTWFFNSGALQTTFNMGQPFALTFAPITIDDFAGNSYETAQPGFPPGPCVAVNTAAAFQIVYLNEITATGISNNFGNDCLGRFTVRGGFPQYDAQLGGNAVYTIKITLASNPAVKAIIHTSASNLFHLSSVLFSVPQAGLYNVVIEDGKSCPASFQIDMNVCNPVDNVMLTFPDTIVPPAGQICLPVTVENFNIFSGAFSVEWDETILQYNGIQNINPALTSFFGPASLNENQITNGLLGVVVFDNTNPSTINIPDGGTLFDLCFTAIGALGQCSGLGVTNSPAGVEMADSIGQDLALSVDTGQVCIGFLPLTFSYEVIDTTCLGQATLNIFPNGGIPPYDITVTQLPGGPVYNTVNNTIINVNGTYSPTSLVGLTNNTPVTYDICIVDSDLDTNGMGVMRCTTLVVNIPRLGAQLNFVQSPLCNGDSTGIVSATVLFGGTIVPNPGVNYTYAWSPSNLTVQGSQVQNGVPAGQYTVVVTNLSNGCTALASGSLGQPAPISAQLVTTTAASCSGVCDGTITYEAEGGTAFPGPAYKFTWFNETTNSTLNSGTDNPILLGGACAGEYRILIEDALGCKFIDSNMVLTDLRSLFLTTNSIQNVLCNGDNTGSIAVTVVESVITGNNFTFNWSPAGFTPTCMSPSCTYSALPVGTYTLLAFDNLGCQIADTFDITEPTVLRVDSLGQSNPGCTQVNSGSISVQAFGGNGGPATYVYDWSNMAITSSIGGLPFGTYTVTVTDLNGCTVTRQFNLPMPGPPSLTLTTSSAVKCGGDGSLTATAPTAVLIVWTDINGVVIDSFTTSPATIDSLNGGDYIANVFDGVGCFATDTVSLTGVVPMSFSDTTLMEPTCFGFNDGQIAIGVQDGQPPYVQYNWNPPAQPPNSPVIFALTANTYSVTVTDNAGCTLTGTFVLGQPAAITNTFDPTVIGTVTCFGGVPCDGKATPLTKYTDGPGDFNFLWGDGSTDSLRIDLCAGPNIVTITDGNNCFTIDTVDIATPPQITGAVATTETLCFGDSTGTATLTASGGNGGPYTYLWNTGATTANVIGLPAGNYTVTITDNKSCTNSINTIVIGQPGQIVLSTTFTNPTCFAGKNGQTTVEVVGGVPNYTYSWENAAGDDVGDAKTAEMLPAGTYVVTVTDMNGCTSVTNETITDPPAVIGSYEPLAPLTCNGDETILNILTITGGSGGPYRFSVDFGAVLDPDFPVTIGGGTHYITYIDVKDCALTDSIFVAEPAPITVTFDPNVIEVELGATADLEPIITGAAVIGSFTWTNPQALLNPDTLNATAYTFTNLTYTLTVLDSFGCSGSGTVVVNIDPNRNVYLPNIFRPANPSGLNDHFNIYTGLGVELVNFIRIYDRWGELLYQREKFLPNVDNLSEGWDGRFNGDFVNPGVFIYIAEVKFLDGRVLLYRGDVTVVR
ncbi:MAG: gliding motility-associated C-terminal domain-containing protein [Phycisphaerae bacterium]|nr:gliding motility-associated C-terminal domain-containing protein [Saprospiraceae bacterium]